MRIVKFYGLPMLLAVGEMMMMCRCCSTTEKNAELRTTDFLAVSREMSDVTSSLPG
jgi:hypothetical protein